jgi:hypothetical protein
MHPNAYKGPLVSASSRKSGFSKPNKPNKKRQYSDDRPSANLSKYGPAPDSKKNRSSTSSVYCNVCKTAGKPENVWSSHHTRDCPNNPNPSGKDLERKLRDDFKGRARGNNANDSYYGSGGYGTLGRHLNDDNRMDEDDPRDRHRSASLDDDDRSRSEYYSHCAITAPLIDDIATSMNTLDASTLADPTPESANKDSENIIAGPDPDSEQVRCSNAIQELLMDISDSDESQVDTWSGGIPGGIAPKRDEAPEADDHKESLHFFPNNQQITVRLIKNRNMLPEGALTDDVLDTINSSHDLRRFPLSYNSIKRFFFNLDAIPRRAPRAQNSRHRKLQAEREEFQKLSADEKEFVRIRKNRDKALFGAVEDQCNDSVGLLMAAEAYLHHDTSTAVTCDPPEGKDEPPRQWFWDAEREVKYYVSTTPSLLAGEVYQLKRDIRALLAWLRKNQHAYIPGQRSPWSPANADWNRDPDIEEELDFPNADTIEESLRLMDFPGPALFRVNETEVPDTSNYVFK